MNAESATATTQPPAAAGTPRAPLARSKPLSTPWRVPARCL